MKIAALGCIICVTSLLIFSSCITTQKANLSTEDLKGTWLNEEYNRIGDPHDAKEVVAADGVVELYQKTTDTEFEYTYKISIVESWYDDNGDIWFKSEWLNVGDTADVETTILFYTLDKLSDSGTVWESCYNPARWPTELSPLEGGYSIHFRQ
jgi:hypothetical protein